ncbi:hypothetical protein AMATHDRAFT_8161 [Amanita thiersii Skay4041]|uniref:BZIP domain-containing protein n=1 Tax=Amanita thiersii Skay4041 TaxID=703135 RepID=A0A2A9N9Z5_9AGAR|nr:hypothetical protein AMATHDRAFT_8161 [Amanita thiersii Skay4041]
MLVDNSTTAHFNADFSDFINTDLFALPNPSSSSPSSDNDTSPPQSPYHSLLTTPQQDQPPVSFPDFSDPSSSTFASSSASSIFSFLDEDPLKGMGVDPTLDYMSLSGIPPHLSLTYPGTSIPMNMPMDFSMNLQMDGGLQMDDMAASSSTDVMQNTIMSIDPALVGTPAPSISTTDFDAGEEDDDGDSVQDASSSEPSSSNASGKAKDEPQRERLTLTIAPVKVGGHGKSRKGTVQSGGVVKKSSLTPSSASSSSRDKENSSSLLLATTTAAQSAAAVVSNAAAVKKVVANNKARAASEAASDAGDFDISSFNNKDDLPADWRPPPEVFAKMTSKEKRQLRNKISARNFRVRRKEYISTLEGDIAERDRLLDAVRTELGSTQSENLALRQEIAALKKVLLEGRGAEALASLNLPPPAPLATTVTTAGVTLGMGAGTATSVGAAPGGGIGSSSNSILGDNIISGGSPHSSATNATTSVSTPSSSSTSSLSFLTPNTQKDLPSSPRLGAAAFWGGSTRGGFGMGLGGGVTPVHTVLVPDLSLSLSSGAGADQASDKMGSVLRVLQENMNPALNGAKNVNMNSHLGFGMGSNGFEGFADINPFTMKTLDAYRMHLWGKMAAQHRQNTFNGHPTKHTPTPQLTGLASGLRPHFFSSPPSSSAAGAYLTPPSTPPGLHTNSNSYPHTSMGSTLSTLLSGKHAALGYPGYTGLATPPGSPHLGKGSLSHDRERETERTKEKEHAALAALAGQTIFKKLGSAFWDAFSGSSSSISSPAASTSTSTPNIPSLNPTVGAGAGLGSGGNGMNNKMWDVDKVRKVLEGKAVVKVVDVEPVVPSTVEKKEKECCRCAVSEILEESMRSLSLGKRA